MDLLFFIWILISFHCFIGGRASLNVSIRAEQGGRPPISPSIPRSTRPCLTAKRGSSRSPLPTPASPSPCPFERTCSIARWAAEGRCEPLFCFRLPMANCARGMLDSMRKTALQADPSTRGLGWARATSKKPKRNLELDPPAPLNHCKPVREKETAFLPNGASGTKSFPEAKSNFRALCESCGKGVLQIPWR